jgi:cell division protein FtsW (lipid II flippase)
MRWPKQCASHAPEEETQMSMRDDGQSSTVRGRLVRWAVCAAFVIATMNVTVWWRTSTHAIVNHTASGKAPWAKDGAVRALDTLTVSLDSPEPVIVGSAELGQPQRNDSAESEHFALQRAGDSPDRIFIRNVAQRRKLDLAYVDDDGTEMSFSSATWIAEAGDRLILSGFSVDVISVSPRTISLRIDDRGRRRAVSFGLDGVRIDDGGGWLAVDRCRIVSWSERKLLRPVIDFLRLSEFLDRSDGLKSAPLFDLVASDPGDRLLFGGGLDCARRGDNHVAVAALPLDSLRLVRGATQFYFAPGAPASGHAPLVRFLRRGREVVGFSGIGWPLRMGPPDNRTLTRITAGRTSYSVEVHRGPQGPMLPQQPHFEVAFTPIEKAPVFRLDPDPEESSPYEKSDKLDFDEDQKIPPQPENAANERKMTKFAILQALPVTSANYVPALPKLRIDRSGYGTGLTRYQHWLRIGMILTSILLLLATRFIDRVRKLRAAQLTSDLYMPRRRRRKFGAFLRGAAFGGTLTLSFAPELAGLAGWKLGFSDYVDATIANWALAGVVLAAAAPREYLASLLFLLFTALAAFGSSTLLALAADADTTYWSTFFIKQKMLFFDVVPPWIVAIALQDMRRVRPTLHVVFVEERPVFLVSLLRWGPAVALLGTLAVWTVVGGQTGLGDFSPIEFGKVAITFIIAGVLIAYDPARLLNGARLLNPRSLVAGAVRFLAIAVATLLVPLAAFVALAAAEPWFKSHPQWPNAYFVAFVAIVMAASLIVPPWAIRRFAKTRLMLGGFVPFTDSSIGAGRFALVVLVSAALLATPVIKSDFSPVLIIGSLALVMFTLYFYMHAAQWFWDVLIARFVRTAGIPQRFSPGPSGWDLTSRYWWREAIRIVASGWVAFIVVIMFWIVLNWQALVLPSIGLSRLPPGDLDKEAEKAAALQELTGSLKGALRPAIVNRFISWYDLGEPRASSAEKPERPKILYRDLGLQVIRSRAVIAAASCASSPDIAPPRTLLTMPLTWMADAAELAASLWSWSNDGAIARELCAPPADRSRRDPLLSERDQRLLDGGNPVRIPVVQFDFTGAFVIGRFGVGTALALIAVQAMVVLVGFLGFLQLIQPRAQSIADAAARRFLGLVVAGSATLFGLHWIIAWSNVIGILPVMGQPMTWISAGVSHHLLMAFPCVIVSILAMRYAYFQPGVVPFDRPPAPGRFD